MSKHTDPVTLRISDSGPSDSALEILVPAGRVVSTLSHSQGGARVSLWDYSEGDRQAILDFIAPGLLTACKAALAWMQSIEWTDAAVKAVGTVPFGPASDLEAAIAKAEGGAT